jgi:hypothetical protein
MNVSSGRERPSGADTTCNTPWGQNSNPWLPGAGRMPQGGRIMHKKVHKGVEKLCPPRVYLVRSPEADSFNRTPGPGHYNVAF